MAKREAGTELDAYCTKCKLILAHVIIAMKGNRVAKVECNTCHNTHAYRASIPGSRTRARKTARGASAPSYSQLMEGRDLSTATKYKMAVTFQEGQVVDHTRFGIGLVTRVLSDAKIQVVFPEVLKVLVHAR